MVIIRYIGILWAIGRLIFLDIRRNFYQKSGSNQFAVPR